MSELNIDQLSPRSQKSRFATLIVGEANKLAKMSPKESHAALEAHARDRVAYGQYSDRLRKEVDMDGLTGLLNLQAILRETKEAMERVEKNGGSMQIMFSDVRRFKNLNDTHNHPTGNKALLLIATGMKGNVPKSDKVGRYGGDENLIVLATGNKSVPDLIRQRVHNALKKEISPYNSLRIDFGVADYDPTRDGKLAPEDLIKRADQAMYYAKNNRLDEVVRWDPSMANIVIPNHKG